MEEESNEDKEHGRVKIRYFQWPWFGDDRRYRSSETLVEFIPMKILGSCSRKKGLSMVESFVRTDGVRWVAEDLPKVICDALERLRSWWVKVPVFK